MSGAATSHLTSQVRKAPFPTEYRIKKMVTLRTSESIDTVVLPLMPRVQTPEWQSQTGVDSSFYWNEAQSAEADP